VDKVYVLGVTDQNINLITEIGDQGIINGLVTGAREKEAGPVLPPSILERFLPGLFRRPEARNKDFNFQIQKQIRRLQSIVDGPVRRLREDDWNE
jgi:flagellar biogenesis protein FliO